MTQSSSNTPKDSNSDQVLDAANDNRNDTDRKNEDDLPLDSAIESQGNGVAVEIETEAKVIISSLSPDVVIAEVSESDSEQDSSAKLNPDIDASADNSGVARADAPAAQSMDTQSNALPATISQAGASQAVDSQAAESQPTATVESIDETDSNTAAASSDANGADPDAKILKDLEYVQNLSDAQSLISQELIDANDTNTDAHSPADIQAALVAVNKSKSSNDSKTDAVSDTDDTSILENQSEEQDEDDDETEEEREQKKREAQLEAYKQFVAYQENNREIDYPQVRVKIEANALPSKMYFLMNALSAIIASYGLVADSAAVVIGAMLVAMMLGPITGVALAIIDYRMPLLRKSLFTVAAGGLLVVTVGFIVGILHQGQPLTSEILSRTQPTSMDLMIALAGGTAGAYAMISPNLSVAVVGVAVATALVPPLAASGILFANGEMSLGFGAFLLAVTNIIAIQFTNAMVLWFSGFRRLVDDDYKSGTYLTFFRRNAVTLLLLVGLGIYLSINLNTIAKQQRFESDVKAAINDHFIDRGNVLTNTQFDKQDGYQNIRAVVRGETDPTPYDVQQIEAVITQDIEENYPNYLPVKLQLRYLPIQVIESNPLIQDKLDETDAAILTN
ncbi:DUF389 domain-containing protein [Psychrobacter pygoscelis]|uniref:DUF389 domain-containing protein n=1 Tax=Psychrobacter pygoscelis TaxID=2488563 RepID=UPI0010403952|nr:DUF389 domain-containing protein [Psychrobacter pygoscelis]